ncbi:hypothetical protein OROGR_009328 [Orobanche gracilis]
MKIQLFEAIMEGPDPVSSPLSSEDGPESWEVSDVEASMRRFIISSTKDYITRSNNQDEIAEGSGSGSSLNLCSGPSDMVNTVDQFLWEAIQNPRERLSV